MSIVTYFCDTMVVLPAFTNKIQDLYVEAYGDFVKGSGEYLVSLMVERMWKYRKRRKECFRNVLCILILVSVSRHKQLLGKHNQVEWIIPTFIKEKSIKVAPSHFFSYLPAMLMQESQGINFLIAFSWNCWGLVLAVERRAYEAAYLSHFRFYLVLKFMVYFSSFISLCIIMICNVLPLMIGLFRSGDG